MALFNTNIKIKISPISPICYAISRSSSIFPPFLSQYQYQNQYLPTAYSTSISRSRYLDLDFAYLYQYQFSYEVLDKININSNIKKSWYCQDLVKIVSISRSEEGNRDGQNWLSRPINNIKIPWYWLWFTRQYQYSSNALYKININIKISWYWFILPNQYQYFSNDLFTPYVLWNKDWGITIENVAYFLSSVVSALILAINCLALFFRLGDKGRYVWPL